MTRPIALGLFIVLVLTLVGSLPVVRRAFGRLATAGKPEVGNAGQRAAE